MTLTKTQAYYIAAPFTMVKIFMAQATEEVTQTNFCHYSKNLQISKPTRKVKKSLKIILGIMRHYKHAMTFISMKLSIMAFNIMALIHFIQSCSS